MPRNNAKVGKLPVPAKSYVTGKFKQSTISHQLAKVPDRTAAFNRGVAPQHTGPHRLRKQPEYPKNATPGAVKQTHTR